MPLTDFGHDELVGYRPVSTAPYDFDAFWQRTLDDARTQGGAVKAERVTDRFRLRTVEVDDLRFPGWQGEPVAVALVRTAAAAESRSAHEEAADGSRPGADDRDTQALDERRWHSAREEQRMAQGRVTLADVARHAGLSVTAASLVLNRRRGTRISAEAQARVFAAADELGYRPNMAARSLRTRKTATIAFVSDVVATTRFAGDMIRGALDAAHEREHVMLIAETQGDPETERQTVEAMLDRQIDGFVYAAMASRLLTVPPAMSSRPAVLLNAGSTEAVASVLPDDEGAGHSVATLLLEHGHRRIAVIGRAEAIERDPRRSLAAGPRLRGIRRALAQHGIRLTPGGRAEHWEPDDGYEAMRALLRRRTLTPGIICMNDRLALGAYQALAEAGLGVPDDVSVVSFDDDPIAGWLRPGLTTAALPHERMGRLAVEMLLDRDYRPGTQWVPMPLRVRASVAAPRD